MNKIIKQIIAVITSLSYLCSFRIYAQTTDNNICKDTGIVFAFFNGVQTTAKEANDSLKFLKNLYGEKSSKGDNIKYEVMYNYTNGMEDFAETFEQRLNEQQRLLEGRWELFFEAPKGNGTWIDRISNTVTSTKDIWDSYIQKNRAFLANYFTSMLGTPPTQINYAEHKARIDNFVVECKKVLFVAHSQGNLFVNQAYDYALTKVKSESVKVIHIAPASPIINGVHTLDNQDLVINGLRSFGNVANNTDDIPDYLNRPAGINGQKDPLGHGLLEIYLNPNLSTSIRIKNAVESAFNDLIAPEAKAQSGFITATLTWDGIGDVDLHTYEPDNNKIFYGNKVGKSGYLDVDNIVANGPEHYYASCDKTKLQTGIYKIGIANYHNAKGRNATVQIASWNDGVLGTKTLTLEDETRNSTGYYLFNVKIDKNSENGKYSASLID